MARKFKTNSIIDPVKAPLTKRSLEHINSAYDELGEDLVKSLIGTYTTNDVVILRGCDVAVTSGSIPGTGTATLSEGALFYNGRVYKVDANGSLATTSPDTLVWEIVESVVTGDPATFSDGNTYDFHVIEKFRLVAGSPGSGIANYDGATVKNINDATNTGFSVIASTNLTGAAVRGVASKINGVIYYSLRVSGTTVADSGYSWTIGVPANFQTPQQNAGGIGLNPVIGTRRNFTDTQNLTFVQNSSDAFQVTVNSSNQIVVSFGGDLSIGASKSLEFVFQMTCRAK
jgi:hypothetical protein